MRKIFSVSILLLGLSLFLPSAQAFTVSDGPNASEIKERYAGSIIVNDNNFTKQYWYVHPATSEKYFIKNNIKTSRLLKNLGIGISNADLNKIATDSQSTGVDYEFTHQMRGQILLQTDELGQAWYVNPLDGYRYQIANGQTGLETLKKLALDINYTKLNALPSTNNPEFIDNSKRLDFSIYTYTKNYLKKNYYKPAEINDTDLFYGSLKGLAQSSKDNYAEFYSPKGKQNFLNSIEGNVEGIGALVEARKNRLIIVSPLDSSPAEKAGLKPLDQVWTVDGIDIKGFSTNESTNLIKGPEGTKVILKIYRPSTDALFEVSVKRAKIDLHNIITKTLDDDIAYFKINMFSNDLLKKFKPLKKALIKSNTKGVIIDLRNNPGGYSRSAFNLAELWLDDNSLISQEKYNNKTKTYSSKFPQEINLPTIILTNQGTASASEIFISTLKAYNLAETVGQTTFGKGTGQEILSFKNGSALKYTKFEWLDPLDQSVEGIGIEPDYQIDNTEQIDLQLKKARQLLSTRSGINK